MDVFHPARNSAGSKIFPKALMCKLKGPLAFYFLGLAEIECGQETNRTCPSTLLECCERLLEAGLSTSLLDLVLAEGAAGTVPSG